MSASGSVPFYPLDVLSCLADGLGDGDGLLWKTNLPLQGRLLVRLWVACQFFCQVAYLIAL